MVLECLSSLDGGVDSEYNSITPVDISKILAMQNDFSVGRHYTVHSVMWSPH